MDYVVPAERNLEDPPGPEEGKIVDVQIDHVDDQHLVAKHKECQECGDPVRLSESHVVAEGWRRNSIGREFFQVVLCDRECWFAWANSSSN